MATDPPKPWRRRTFAGHDNKVFWRAFHLRKASVDLGTRSLAVALAKAGRRADKNIDLYAANRSREPIGWAPSANPLRPLR
jgi:hypothetical protein